MLVTVAVVSLCLCCDEVALSLRHYLTIMRSVSADSMCLFSCGFLLAGLAMDPRNYSRELAIRGLVVEGEAGFVPIGQQVPIGNRPHDLDGLGLGGVDLPVIHRRFNPLVENLFGDLLVSLGFMHVPSLRDFLTTSPDGRQGEF